IRYFHVTGVQTCALPIYMVFRLPLEMTKEVVGELEEAKKGGNKPFVMQVVPAMSVFYLGLQHKLPPFNSIDVRKAFNYAVDRERSEERRVGRERERSRTR